MSVTSNRSIVITQTGDVEYSQEFAAAVNATGSGQNQLLDLVSGNNTIDVPSNCAAVTIIIPDQTNDVQLLLKGVNGDTGIALSLLDPCSISLNNVSSFVLNADDDITVRLIFS